MEIKTIDEFMLRELEITSNDPQVVQLARECKTCEEYVVKKLDQALNELEVTKSMLMREWENQKKNSKKEEASNNPPKQEKKVNLRRSCTAAHEGVRREYEVI